MKTNTLLFAASMAVTVAAQSLSDYFPQCSVDCLEDATKKATNCSVTDAVCFCVQSNYEAIYNQGLTCVLKDCGKDVAVDKVLPAAIQFCSAASSSASAAATANSASTTAATTPKTTQATQTTEATEATSSAQSSAKPTTKAAVTSNTVASGRPASTTGTTSLSTAAAAAAKPLVTAAMLVAGAAVAMI
ncbi:hypothetical protein TASIC1_0006020500 [Trichoderma asperellum]|uniref:CFEM domain-containing protein n=1 Tax=Trichoderma asperellum TaxID=101201 RepID=A0A6V8QUR8_TRIAP|nr:hypothetical protein TASIC1_0006020500 [Trichoderma asperellum]